MKDINKTIKLIERNPHYKKIADEMDVFVKVAIEVNEARKFKKWTQTRLAKEIGTTQKVVSRIETANTNIGLDLFQRFARALDLKLQLGKILLVKGKSSMEDFLEKESSAISVIKTDGGLINGFNFYPSCGEHFDEAATINK